LYGDVVPNDDDRFNPDDCYQLQDGDILFAGGGDVMTAYYLADRSVAIDGTGVTSGSWKDLAGITRPIGVSGDYGAFEYAGNHVMALDAEYDGSNQNLVALGSSVDQDEPVLYSYSTDGGTTWTEWSESVPAAKNAGEYPVRVQFTTVDGNQETVEVTARITPKAITVDFVADEKVYDGTTVATISDDGYTFNTLYTGDDVTVESASAAFEDKNAGADKQVNVSSFTLGGADAGNYTVTVGTATGTITKKGIQLNFTAADKNYDGTQTAEVTGYSFDALIGDDDVTATITAEFEDANPGPEKTVTAVSVAYDGADKDNYSYTVNTTKASIKGPEKASTVVTTAEDIVDPFDNLISLREALTVYYNKKEMSDALTGNDGKLIYVNGKFSYADANSEDPSITNTTITFADDLSVIDPDAGYELGDSYTYTYTDTDDNVHTVTVNIDYNGLVIDGRDADGNNHITFANETFQIFTITEAANITFNGLTFKNIATSENGSAISIAGGLTDSGEIVTINNGKFLDNTGASGAAIYAGSLTTRINSGVFADNAATADGGAVYGAAGTTLTVTDSDFTRNTATAGNGGAIYGATVTLSGGTSSGNTFTRNTAAASGGAVYGTTVNSTNGVYADNSAGDAENDIVGNGGAIYGSHVESKDDIFTRNKATDNGGAIYSDSDTTVIVDGSHFTANSAANGGAIYGVAVNVKDALFAENKALGKTETVTEEVPITVTVVDYEYDETGDYVWGIFRDDQGDDEEYFAIADLPKYSYNSATSSYEEDPNGTFIHELSYNIYYDLANPNPTYTRALQRSRQVTTTVDSGETETVTHNVTTGGSGGAIYSSATLTVENSEFTSNTANARGGAVYGVTIDITNGDFTKNTAGIAGGAIYGLGASDVTITGGEFVRNSSAATAGAVYADKLTVTGAAFRNNSTEDYGGAILASSNGAAVIISDSLFESNTAYCGGAFTSYSGGSVIFNENTAFTGNTAFQGGAVYAEDTESLTLNKTVFDRNISDTNGGAVYATASGHDAITVIDSAFTGNVADGKGGAVYVQGGAVLEITRGTFDGNKVLDGEGGGAIYYTSDYINHITITDSTFTNNQAIGEHFDSSGGAIRFYNSSYNRASVTIENTLFRGNSATGSGGAISGTSISLTVNYSRIVENEAGGVGGGINIYRDDLTVYQSLIADNTAAGNGGGVYFYDKGTVDISWSTIAGNSGSAGADLYLKNNGNSMTATVSYSILINAEASISNAVLNYVNTLYGDVVPNDDDRFNPDDCYQLQDGDILFAGGGDVMTAYYLADRSVAI
ncbi:MAG: hypothetical protein J6S40_03600, partial [Thermoguttaceae bacterium]|nr:hypothetical protein [Thermoguttaceae bacterium]